MPLTFGHTMQWQKHNKEKVSDVKKLHEKHGKKDAWKFAKLITKLVAKYPKAIKSIKTKEQKMWPCLKDRKGTLIGKRRQ